MQNTLIQTLVTDISWFVGVGIILSIASAISGLRKEDFENDM